MASARDDDLIAGRFKQFAASQVTTGINET
jgi:hypothetical protein